MSAKTKKATVPAPEPAPAHTTTVQNCTITNTSAANEHTRAAVEALANAARANADAIAEVARALKGEPATMQSGIHVGGGL